MNQIIITVNSMKSVSTVQLKHNEDYIVENTEWTGDKCKFPVRALLRGVYRLLKIKYKRNFPIVINYIKQKLIN